LDSQRGDAVRCAVEIQSAMVEPVRVYSLQVGLPAQPKPATSTTLTPPEKPAEPLALPDRPSIAVLPFQNMSGDPEQEYFADGMVEDIITGLSRIKRLFVIARNSSFVYKGADPSCERMTSARNHCSA
jgi:adenylate cyclase